MAGHGRRAAGGAGGLAGDRRAAGADRSPAGRSGRPPFSYEFDKPGQRIDTSLLPSGRIHLQWRPTVSEGEVDRSLTARSSAVLDVQEDGLRAAWQTTLQFRRGQRDSFTFYVPADYLVEKVEGGNVRGWEVRKEAAARWSRRRCSSPPARASGCRCGCGAWAGWARGPWPSSTPRSWPWPTRRWTPASWSSAAARSWKSARCPPSGSAAPRSPRAARRRSRRDRRRPAGRAALRGLSVFEHAVYAPPLRPARRRPRHRRSPERAQGRPIRADPRKPDQAPGAGPPDLSHRSPPARGAEGRSGRGSRARAAPSATPRGRHAAGPRGRRRPAVAADDLSRHRAHRRRAGGAPRHAPAAA